MKIEQKIYKFEIELIRKLYCIEHKGSITVEKLAKFLSMIRLF